MAFSDIAETYDFLHPKKNEVGPRQERVPIEVKSRLNFIDRNCRNAYEHVKFCVNFANV